MIALPIISLGVALVCIALAWSQRTAFARRPYLHWFLYLNITAVGLHQFEEYGWPGGFRDGFVAVFASQKAAEVVPPASELVLLNILVLLPIFALIGWVGTRVVWVGLAGLFINFGNGFFHLTSSVTRLDYLPGTITGTLLYLPLGLLAAVYAVRRGDVSPVRLLLAFSIGTAASFLPFIHVWLMA